MTSHLDKWFKLSIQYMRWAMENPTSALQPSEYMVYRMELPAPSETAQMPTWWRKILIGGGG
jgi:hypothetical protein